MDAKEAYARILAATGTRTQTELAAILGVRQPCISDALRSGRIPANWLLTLVEKNGINPVWIRTGKGARRLAPVEEDA